MYLNFFDEITFVSYFTVYPEKENIDAYLKDFKELLLKKKTSKLVLLGKQLSDYDEKTLPESIINL